MGGNTKTVACVMEGPVARDAVKNMAGARVTAPVRCAMENRAVEILMGEWVAEFEWHRKSWSMIKLTPREQIEREANKPKKTKKIPKEDRSENTPEERIAIADEAERIRADKEGPDPKAEKAKHFKKEIADAKAAKAAIAAEIDQDRRSRPMQRNEGKWEFSLDETKEAVILEVGVPKFLDTSAIDLNVEPTWIAMEIKGKQFLIHTPLEINPDQCKAERSQLTGSLVLTMPFVGGVIKAAAVHEDRVSKIYAKQERAPSNSLKDEDIGQASTIDLCNIVGQNEAARKDMRLDEKNYSLDRANQKHRKESVGRKPKAPSASFVDNPDVPPLC